MVRSAYELIDATRGRGGGEKRDAQNLYPLSISPTLIYPLGKNALFPEVSQSSGSEARSKIAREEDDDDDNSERG
jgi:hypothetical protein